MTSHHNTPQHPTTPRHETYPTQPKTQPQTHRKPKRPPFPPAAAPTDVERELAVLLLLADHPACLALHQVFEEPPGAGGTRGPGRWVLVTELCAGGRLFDRLEAEVRGLPAGVGEGGGAAGRGVRERHLVGGGEGIGGWRAGVCRPRGGRVRGQAARGRGLACWVLLA